MIITKDTQAKEISEKTKAVVRGTKIPNMILENAGKTNGFASSESAKKYWLNKLCNRHSS